MSRTTRNINQITQELDRISGLDGIVADKMENLADEVHSIVEEILTNHSKASLFDYYGNGKSGLSNVLDEIEKRKCNHFKRISRWRNKSSRKIPDYKIQPCILFYRV